MVGPGGIKCPCCRPANTVKESRKILNRVERRKTKQIEWRIDNYGDLIDEAQYRMEDR